MIQLDFTFVPGNMNRTLLYDIHLADFSHVRGIQFGLYARSADFSTFTCRFTLIHLQVSYSFYYLAMR